MRLVFISDLHTQLDKVHVPYGDVLICAGDATYRGTPEQLDAFNTVWKSLPHPTKLFTPGNHDLLLEKNYRRAIAHLPDVTVLINQAFEVEGIKLWFSPYTPIFYDWAFMKARGLKIKAIWDQIPLDTDVLVTHGPPFGHCDLTLSNDRAGCEELMLAVERVKPKLHIFGHIHEAYGVSYNQHTTFINASTCTRDYKPTNPPIVHDWDTKTIIQPAFLNKNMSFSP